MHTLRTHSVSRSIAVLAAMHLHTLAVAQPAEPQVKILPPPVPSTSPQQTISCPKPEYPPAAIRVEAQGTTRVHLRFNDDGLVAAAMVVKASGDTRAHRLLDNVTLEAFRKCRLQHVEASDSRERIMEYTFKLVYHETIPNP